MSRKQIGAISLLVVIALLYLATIILAFIDSPLAKSALMAALFCTIVVPAVAYGIMLVTRSIKNRNNNGDEA